MFDLFEIIDEDLLIKVHHIAKIIALLGLDVPAIAAAVNVVVIGFELVLDRLCVARIEVIKFFVEAELVLFVWLLLSVIFVLNLDLGVLIFILFFNLELVEVVHLRVVVIAFFFFHDGCYIHDLYRKLVPIDFTSADEGHASSCREV